MVWLAALCCADARVVRIAVERREPAGAYERLTGHFFGGLDPAAPLNAIITDLRLAPMNSRGQVEYAATFTLPRPLDVAKLSGVLWYEVPNRGIAAGDPRPSLEERYGTHDTYVAKVRAAARRLVEQRFLLTEDAERLVREAEASEVLR
jgi:alpha/beta hydrolase family protein